MSMNLNARRELSLPLPAHWSERYLGLPYVEGANDCGEFAARVQREVFGRAVRLPTERAAGRRGQSRQIESLLDTYGVRTETPADGDAVLMKSGSLWHIGVYCGIQGAPWVLHAMKNAGQVCRHRVRDLAKQGLALEGYYRWK